jgi:hypothetical protein
MLINMEISEQRRTAGDDSLVPFTRSNIFKCLAVGSRRIPNVAANSGIKVGSGGDGVRGVRRRSVPASPPGESRYRSPDETVVGNKNSPIALVTVSSAF